MSRQQADRSLRDALEPIADSPGPSHLAAVSRAIMQPFTSGRSDSTSILRDLAPVIMTPRMIKGVASSSASGGASSSSSHTTRRAVDFAVLGRAPMRLGLGAGRRRITSHDLQILEATPSLLESEVPEPEGVAHDVSLLRGFKATMPGAERGKARRRKVRMSEGRPGLARAGLGERGMLVEGVEEGDEGGRDRKGKGKERARRKKGEEGKKLSREELTMQVGEIMVDKENVRVRRTLINSEIDDISQKIAALDLLRDQLNSNLLKLQEEELELNDELEGVQERLAEHDFAKPDVPSVAARRRKGPAFLPEEHDDLPPGVAFMTLAHNAPITCLDFTEPYGTLVSGDRDGVTRVWDLLEGVEVGRLRGHSGPTKCVQVEQEVCVTGGEDGAVRVWDLRRVEDTAAAAAAAAAVGASSFVSSDTGDGEQQRANGVPETGAEEDTGPCVHVLEGHTKAVTALYFEDNSLVTGASDKTLRQWDLTTGQCVLTMDILWAIAHPSDPSLSLSSSGLLAAASREFAYPLVVGGTEGAGEVYTDFVGSVQAWGYALVSGSGDGGVRMWDMRTGQAHRTLLGHTAPVTSVMFDEMNVVSGSLDKTVRIWDMRMGKTSELVQYDGPVTSLQFDSRKVLACASENGVKIWNRTTRQQSTLTLNGHTQPALRARYIDRYMLSGGADGVVKAWAL